MCVCAWGRGGEKEREGLQSSSTSTTLSSGVIRRSGRDIFDSANLHAGSGQGSESGLSTGTRGLGLVATGSSQLDVESGDAFGLALLSDVLGGKHGGVRGSFVSVSLHLHATGHSDDGFSAGQVGHVHEGIVEGSEDVSDSKHILTLGDAGDLGLEDGHLLLGRLLGGGGGGDGLFGRHFDFLFFRHGVWGMCSTKRL